MIIIRAKSTLFASINSKVYSLSLSHIARFITNAATKPLYDDTSNGLREVQRFNDNGVYEMNIVTNGDSEVIKKVKKNGTNGESVGIREVKRNGVYGDVFYKGIKYDGDRYDGDNKLGVVENGGYGKGGGFSNVYSGKSCGVFRNDRHGDYGDERNPNERGVFQNERNEAQCNENGQNGDVLGVLQNNQTRGYGDNYSNGYNGKSCGVFQNDQNGDYADKSNQNVQYNENGREFRSNQNVGFRGNQNVASSSGHFHFGEKFKENGVSNLLHNGEYCGVFQGNGSWDYRDNSVRQNGVYGDSFDLNQNGSFGGNQSAVHQNQSGSFAGKFGKVQQQTGGNVTNLQHFNGFSVGDVQQSGGYGDMSVSGFQYNQNVGFEGNQSAIRQNECRSNLQNSSGYGHNPNGVHVRGPLGYNQSMVGHYNQNQRPFHGNKSASSRITQIAQYGAYQESVPTLHGSSNVYSGGSFGETKQGVDGYGAHNGYNEVYGGSLGDSGINDDMSSKKDTLEELDRLCNEGKLKEAFEVMDLLEKQGKEIDLARYLRLMQACGEAAVLKM